MQWLSNRGKVIATILSSHCTPSPLDCIGLDQVQTDAHCAEQRAQIGELAFQLGVLRARDLPIVNGLVLPAQHFTQHCQRAAIPAQLPADQSLQGIAQQCQTVIEQTPLASSFLLPVQQTWEAADFGHPLVVIRPSFGGSLPISTHDLLTPQIGAINELEPMIKAVWAEVFCARNLCFWPQSGNALNQIPLAILIQPLLPIEQSGRFWITSTNLIIERFWGMQWLGAPQEVEVDTTVINWATGQRRSTHPDCQQLVHTVFGHWPQALPIGTPLTIPGNHWLLPHALAPLTAAAEPPPNLVSPVTDAAAVELAQRLWTHFQQPLRVDWQYTSDGLKVQNLYVGEVAPISEASLDLEISHSQLAQATTNLNSSDDDAISTGLVAAPGRAIGQAIVVGTNQNLLSALSAETILVTQQLPPSWLPLIRNAAGIVAEQGGMTSHAAVLARTLGIPAIVGVTVATQKIRTGDWLEMHAGQIRRLTEAQAIAAIQDPLVAAPSAPSDTETPVKTATQLLATISHPSQISLLDDPICDGIGLLRGEHLLAPHLADCSPWQPLSETHSTRLSQALFQPLQQVLQPQLSAPVWYRFADWRTHEVTNDRFAPSEVNPSLGLHGTLRYQHLPDWLHFELQTIAQLAPAQQARLRLVLPFVRSVAELHTCAEMIAAIGLGHLPLWIMAEVPAVLYGLPAFAAAGISGITIGLNDLLQLIFGVDREQTLMADFFDPSHPQVKSVLRSALQQCITSAKQLQLGCTVCSVPMDEAFIEFLVQCGVTGISMNPSDLGVAQQAIVRAETADK